MTSLAHDEFEEFISGCAPAVREIALRARELAQYVMPDAIEQFDAPARLISYGRDRTYKGMICAIALQKSYVNLMFAKGAQLPDPAGLLEGAGKQARHVKLRQPEDVDRPAVRDLLLAAL